MAEEVTSNHYRTLAAEFIKEDQQKNGDLPINLQIAVKEFARWLDERKGHETTVAQPFPYPTDRDGWICSVCHGWNVPKDRVCMHSHLPTDLQKMYDQHAREKGWPSSEKASVDPYKPTCEGGGGGGGPCTQPDCEKCWDDDGNAVNGSSNV